MWGLLRPSMELSMLFNSKLLSHLSQILVKSHMTRFYAGTGVEMRCPTGVPLVSQICPIPSKGPDERRPLHIGGFTSMRTSGRRSFTEELWRMISARSSDKAQEGRKRLRRFRYVCCGPTMCWLGNLPIIRTYTTSSRPSVELLTRSEGHRSGPAFGCSNGLT